MPTYDVCTADPRRLLPAELCLGELSKDLGGDLVLRTSEPRPCAEIDCRTLTTQHALDVTLKTHQCDSEIGKLFDGKLSSPDLTTVFARGGSRNRGMHAGNFEWVSAAGVFRGRLSGMTNEGTHRETPFRDCQRCDEPGVLEGRLCGRVIEPADPRLAGAQVFGAYRLRLLEPGAEGVQGPITGTLEGVVVRPCRPEVICVSFTTVGNEPNPRVVGGLSVETLDQSGPTPTTSVVIWAGMTGLHMWLSSTVTFAQPASLVQLTLVQFAVPATATALDAGGAVVASAAMTAPQQVPETLTLAAPGIASVVVDAPHYDVMLQRVCWR
jgi:hypothetical protein